MWARVVRRWVVEASRSAGGRRAKAYRANQIAASQLGRDTRQLLRLLMLLLLLMLWGESVGKTNWVRLTGLDGGRGSEREHVRDGPEWVSCAIVEALLGERQLGHFLRRGARKAANASDTVLQWVACRAGLRPRAAGASDAAQQTRQWANEHLVGVRLSAAHQINWTAD